jgi:hypothetical protein
VCGTMIVVKGTLSMGQQSVPCRLRSRKINSNRQMWASD